MKGPRLQDQLSHMIASVNRQLEEELAERLRPQKLPIEQVRVLEFLAKENAARSMRQIADAVLVDPPTLTKIVNRMVSDKLVYRTPSATDRRVVMISLAADGKALHKRISGVLGEQERRLARQLPSDKAEVLRALLRQILN